MGAQSFNDLDVERITTQDRRAVLKVTLLADRFELEQAEDLNDLVFATGPGQCQRVLIDLRSARYINSTAVSLLVRLSGERDLRLAGATEPVRKVLESIGILSLLNVHGTVDEALAAF